MTILWHNVANNSTDCAKKSYLMKVIEKKTITENCLTIIPTTLCTPFLGKLRTSNFLSPSCLALHPICAEHNLPLKSAYSFPFFEEVCFTKIQYIHNPAQRKNYVVMKDLKVGSNVISYTSYISY